MEITDEGTGEYMGVVVKSGWSVIRAYVDPHIYGSTVQLVADYFFGYTDSHDLRDIYKFRCEQNVGHHDEL